MMSYFNVDIKLIDEDSYIWTLDDYKKRHNI